MKRVWWPMTILVVSGGLALAGGSQAKTSHHQVKCAPGYVRRSVRLPERKHGRIVRRHGKIVYVRVQRCVKVHQTNTPTTRTPQPIPGGSSNPVATPSVGTTSPTTTTTTTTTTPPPPPPPPSDGCPSGAPGGSQTIDGHTYTLEGMDTFTKDAPVGSFAQSATFGLTANTLPVVYVGDHGMGWTEYADGWPSTHSANGYMPSTVQSVHDGMLDFYLHDDPTYGPVGADISPLPSGERYQTWGVWSFCERVVPSDSSDLADFHQAPLLWPYDDADWSSAESDFPEADLDATATTPAPYQFSAFAHYGGSVAKDQFQIPAVDPSFDQDQWNVYTQTWGPGFRSYYVDGQLVGTSTNQVWGSQPGQKERWQLQVEPSATGGAGSGHVYIKWVWIGTY